MRIHFQNITLADGSTASGCMMVIAALPVTYWSTDNGNDIWSEWFTTNTIDVQLTTDSGSTAYGFLVDQKEVRTGVTCPPTNPTALAESCHPYANNYDYTWTIIESRCDPDEDTFPEDNALYRRRYRIV